MLELASCADSTTAEAVSVTFCRTAAGVSDESPAVKVAGLRARDSTQAALPGMSASPALAPRQS